jgi:RNA polymerase sigma-70 factor (ECF subfamily)
MGRKGSVSIMLDGGRAGSLTDSGPPGANTGFDEFYAACFRPLTTQLYAYTGDMAAAQDVVQDAFCRALTRWKRVAELDDPAGWVRRVAWNLATSRWRRARTAMAFARRHREEHVAEPGPDRVALAAALATLPEQQRRAVILHYLADLPITDIARQEGVAEGTVKSWLRRGRAALAARLTDRENRRA